MTMTMTGNAGDHVDVVRDSDANEIIQETFAYDYDRWLWLGPVG